MAHRLMKALERPSSYAVKKTDLWSEVTDRIAGCFMLSQLDEVRAWLEVHEMQVPRSWDESFDELIEKKREEIESENIGSIIRDRFDF